jgi:hypothetical protein
MVSSHSTFSFGVLLTRARQGMAIVGPHGASDDHTRQPGFYDDTYAYLQRVGVKGAQGGHV